MIKSAVAEKMLAAVRAQWRRDRNPKLCVRTHAVIAAAHTPLTATVEIRERCGICSTNRLASYHAMVAWDGSIVVRD